LKRVAGAGETCAHLKSPDKPVESETTRLASPGEFHPVHGAHNRNKSERV